MVTNGVVTSFKGQEKFPRATVSVRKDGSVFFMTGNGRDTSENVIGMTWEQMGHVLKEHGAYNSINLDGGGSVTMMAKNHDGEFEVLNKMSDGRMRSISNGILLVRGDIPERPVHIKGEDTRKPFMAPTNLYVDSNNTLKFTGHDDNETRYIVSIDDNIYETSKRSFYLGRLDPREYNISVKAKGNMIGKHSISSEVITYKIQKREISEMIEWLRKFAQNNN